MTGKTLQSSLIQAIRSQFPDEKNLAQELSTVLRLNVKAVYKRLNGTTPFSLDDLGLLARHFELPLEKILYPEKKSFNATFSGHSVQSSCLEYLSEIEKDLSALRLSGDTEVWHVTIGLPDFYHYLFDELALFQAFNWEKLVWDLPAMQGRKFTLAPPREQEILTQAKRLTHLYFGLPILEIWNEYVLDNLFHQILYVVQSGIYEREEDVRHLMATTGQLIEHLQDMASQNRRFVPRGSPAGSSPAFSLYHSDTMNNNIFYLVRNGEEKTVYAVLDNPHFIKTSDGEIVRHVETTIERLLRRAVPLSVNGERHRAGFFQKLSVRRKFYEEKILAALR